MVQAINVERRNGAARTQLKARASDVMDDFAELRKDVNRLADAANKAARAEVKYAGKRLNTVSGELRSRASESVNYATEQVRTHPGAAVGISLGAGLLLGMLLTARR